MGGDDRDEDADNGDPEVQESLTSELAFQTRLYRAQQRLDEKGQEFIEKGEEKKARFDAEAKLAGDRSGLEIGMRASEIDDRFVEMLDETAAARARNEKVQAELAELEEQILGQSSGRFRKAPPTAGKARDPSWSPMKQMAIDKEAADVGARMKVLLEDTQRKSAFTLILLLLTITDFSMAAEGAWDKVGRCRLTLGFRS